MGVPSLLGIKKAIANLDPENVRRLSERPLRVAVCAATPARYAAVADFLLGNLQPTRKQESSSILHSGYEPGGLMDDLVIYDFSVAAPPRSFVFTPERSRQFLELVLKQKPDLGVALARAFPPFREPYINSVIRNTARENTLFSLATALPDVVPSLIELPWAIAEFASDTAFLTGNQLKMAFLIAAASDRLVGYREQKSEVATVIAGAFGWRAIARQIVGKIPFGGGLLGKAAIAYAGTHVVGLSLERLYRAGYMYSREERSALFAEALEQGKKVAGGLLSQLQPELAEKLANGLRKRMSRSAGA